MVGFAQVPKNTLGFCTNTFNFTGIQSQANSNILLAGEREGPFTLKADPDMILWSPCGGTTAIMNMNTECSIPPTQNQALIAVRSLLSSCASLCLLTVCGITG